MTPTFPLTDPPPEDAGADEATDDDVVLPPPLLVEELDELLPPLELQAARANDAAIPTATTVTGVLRIQ